MIIKYPSKVYELMTDNCNNPSAEPSNEDYLKYASMILEIENERLQDNAMPDLWKL
jgi:hypothetical protein